MGPSLEPWLLLYLTQQPSHGYELMERLAESNDAPSAEPSLLYPILRRMEEEGLLTSEWDTEGRGPARRLYCVTPEGAERLSAWALMISQNKDRLERFLDQYAAQESAKEEGEGNVS